MIHAVLQGGNELVGWLGSYVQQKLVQYDNVTIYKEGKISDASSFNAPLSRMVAQPESPA